MTGGRLPFRLTFVEADVPWRSLNSRDGHWSERHRHADLLRTLVGWKAKQRWRGGPCERRVVVALRMHPADRRRRDPDNLAPVVKPMIDGLCDAGLLADDGWKNVAQVRLSVEPDDQADATTWELWVEDEQEVQP